MKSHLIDSAEPLREGGTLTALCGKDVDNAHFTLRYVPGEIDIHVFSTLLLCGECVRAIPLGVLAGKSYLYGINSRNGSNQEMEI